MKKRVLTSIFIVIAVCLAIVSKLLPLNIGDYIFDIFILSISIIAGIEMSGLMTSMNRPLNRYMASFYSIFNYVIMLFSLGAVEFYLLPIIQICSFIIYFIVALIVECIRNKELKFTENLYRAFNTILACIYPGFLLGLMLLINHADFYSGIQWFSIPFIVIIFAITWLTDTFAFLIGSLLKGPKLAPKISPNKTISGAIGGLIGGMGGAMLTYLLVYYIPAFSTILSTYNLTWWIFLIIGVIASILAQAGDLFESKLKRMAGVKDSGNIFPGHGGMLDRIDAMMFTTFVIYIAVLGIII